MKQVEAILGKSPALSSATAEISAILRNKFMKTQEGKGKRGKRRKGKKKFNPCTPFFEETDTWYEAGCHKRKRK